MSIIDSLSNVTLLTFKCQLKQKPLILQITYSFKFKEKTNAAANAKFIFYKYALQPF